MIIDAHVAYGIQARLKGRRKSDSYALSEVLPMEVAEATVELAPIAYWWHAAALREVYRVGEAINGKIAVRSFDGKLYQPLISRDAAVPSTNADGAFFRGPKSAMAAARMVSAANLRDMASRGAPVHGHGKVTFNSANRDDVALGIVAELESSTRESNIARYSKHYSNFLIIDGIVHVSMESPVIDLDLGHFHSFKLNPRDFDHPNPQWVYCISRFEDAKKLFKQHQRSYETVNWKLLTPEIEDPAAIDFDEASFILRLASKSVIKSMRGDNGSSRAPYVSNEPIETMVAFGELRDALEGDSDVLVHEKFTSLVELIQNEGLYLDSSRNAIAVIERLEREDLVPKHILEAALCP